MAHAAIAGGRDMVCGLAFCHRAVVAGGAVAGDAGMAEDRRLEGGDGMAEIAVLTRRQMIGRGILAGGERAVMATAAAAGDALMMKRRWREFVADDMAYTAIAHGRNMVRLLAGGDDAIVAGHADIDDAMMIEDRSGERIGPQMAGGAVFHGRQMNGGFARADHAVMASRAAVDHARMIINAGGKAARGVAGAAIAAERHVIGG